MAQEIETKDLQKIMKALKFQGMDLVLRIIMRTGMRTNELYRIKLQDIDSKGFLKVRASKGSNNVRKPLHGPKGARDYTKPLQSILKQQGGLKALVGGNSQQSFTRMLRRYWEKRRLEIFGYNPPNYTLHDFRATGAMRIYRATKDPMMVKDWLGHRSLSSVTHYIASVSSEDWSQYSI